ncbi:NupC/NupG family nucleoside CNT transporter [Stutzerimonas kirkiae]|uniref:Nucleoside permease n=1 Tax=Stutzerimonas kirkiae TaxID=2211392 RepID=A0A4Q9R5L5_9GAMM|nr:NupC/NupG family nucleoside CNT transporter [Stutzerimonas kirkiae]TBU95787.1 NupC/NupG family nucleoside CNT transporter [Stutzerimonas kirkiae]TBV02778.1 NupC/NupG family nucleoside CNT transporter [Stutzerimonas kirkiae]TBV03728.1 NupC/NupG family nucleoside CNT transporter [Stutzerimonas kirkiae]TBV13291.1 NupC/NupG family nucleoside CNT transporter [Stutzerimonas kirkiae]
MAFLGIIVLFLIAYALSSARHAINWRTIVGAFAFQVGFAAFALYVPWGQGAMESVSSAVSNLEVYANQGIDFLFGGLNDSALMGQLFGNQSFIFALKVLPLIVFFSGLMAVLYHIGVMGLIIRVFGGCLGRVLGTSRTETMSSVANIFVGTTEAPLVIRPFLARMTESELFSVVVCGLASVAGSVLLGYASLGIDMRYLIAASFMAAPGGLLMAKLMIPETEKPHDDPAEHTEFEDREKPVNVIDAAAIGTANGLQLALNVGAMLLVFIALIALLNGLLGWLGGCFGLPGLSLQAILGYLFAPLAFLLGIPWSEAVQAGSLIGQKLVLNEFVAYVQMAAMIDPVRAAAQGVEVLSAHSQVIITFALCGFANLSSIGIIIGGMGVMAPNRRQDLARLGLKAVLAGTLANLMSAAIAGLFVSL